MKIVTKDYGCGTSSSILDYGIEDVVIVSEDNFQHVFDVDDDLFFVGHDFLFFLWDDEAKLKRWIDRSKKHDHWLWCFERIDAIVPVWQQKSHLSISIASKFCNRILACDEDDCKKYGYDWLPQWASNKFYDLRKHEILTNKILFSGQAGKQEYFVRNQLLNQIFSDEKTKELFQISNVERVFSWDSYIKNLLSHKAILNPVGIFRGLNTRAYEVLYSGRLLLQHTLGNYQKHSFLLKDEPNIIWFQDFEDLKRKLNGNIQIVESEQAFKNHNIFARFKSLGVTIK